MGDNHFPPFEQELNNFFSFTPPVQLPGLPWHSKRCKARSGLFRSVTSDISQVLPEVSGRTCNFTTVQISLLDLHVARARVRRAKHEERAIQRACFSLRARPELPTFREWNTNFGEDDFTSLDTTGDDGLDIRMWDPNDDDDLDNGCWNVPPLGADEESSQLRLLRSGQVPTLFWGHTYTNNPLNGFGVLKFHDLVEDMFYSLVYQTSSHPTVELLLSAIPQICTCCIDACH